MHNLSPSHRDQSRQWHAGRPPSHLRAADSVARHSRSNPRLESPCAKQWYWRILHNRCLFSEKWISGFSFFHLSGNQISPWMISINETNILMHGTPAPPPPPPPTPSTSRIWQSSPAKVCLFLISFVIFHLKNPPPHNTSSSSSSSSPGGGGTCLPELITYLLTWE